MEPPCPHFTVIVRNLTQALPACGTDGLFSASSVIDRRIGEERHSRADNSQPRRRRKQRGRNPLVCSNIPSALDRPDS
jgi:hypothetical protein